MLVLSAKPVTAKLQANTLERVRKFARRSGRAPKLVVVLVGNDPASLIYTSKKGQAAAEVQMEHETIHLPATDSPDRVKSVIQRLNADPSVDGILIQRPLPRGFDEEQVLYWISPEKDVDAFHPANAGRLVLGFPVFSPARQLEWMHLLKHYQLEVAGKTACVVGRSSIVGKPMASLLLQADATVLQCHSQTRELASFTRQADILIVAAGKPGLIGAEHVRPGAIVVDVGIHRGADGKVLGDVRHEEVEPLCQAITPVPGGVGPMTIAVLLQNTILAAETRDAAGQGA